MASKAPAAAVDSLFVVTDPRHVPFAWDASGNRRIDLDSFATPQC